MKVAKLQGCGNDFLFTEDKAWHEVLDKPTFVKKICHRNKGIGADGVAYLLKEENAYCWDFYNSDGSGAEMCGNAVRCLARYLFEKEKVTSGSLKTKAGLVGFQKKEQGFRVLMLKDFQVNEIETKLFFVNTGVPHVVAINKENEIEIIKKYRHYDNGKDNNGCNITFLSSKSSPYKVKSYERGVEDFTLACGTGAVAAGLVLYQQKNGQENEFSIQMPGGELRVVVDDRKVYLEGEAEFILEGEYKNV